MEGIEKAAALFLASEHVRKMGWGKTPREIGYVAREMLEGLNDGPFKPRKGD